MANSNCCLYCFNCFKYFLLFNSVRICQVYGFVGLSLLGWILFMVMWLMQALVFWNGMDAIRRFADWAGPAVYVVMLLLTIYLVSKAGISNLSFTIGKGN